MIATYPKKYDKKLNVRAEPKAGAAVVGMLEPGEVVAVTLIENGWCKLSEGWCRAEFMVIQDGEPEEEEQTETEEAPEAPQEPEGESLEDMKLSDLKDLARVRGVDLGARTKKADIVAAITNADD